MTSNPPVILYVKAEGKPSAPEDAEVAANHVVEIDGDLDPSYHANAALDVFHSHVSVDVLDDFTFTVYDATGNRLFDNGEDSYKYKDCGCMAGTVDVLPFETASPAFR